MELIVKDRIPKHESLELATFFDKTLLLGAQCSPVAAAGDGTKLSQIHCPDQDDRVEVVVI